MRKLLTVVAVLLILLVSSCARKGTCPTYADAEIKSEKIS
jgi:hypothetical protein